jgi:hypothetical protein
MSKLNEIMEIIDRVKQYPDKDPAARARRVIGYLKNEALLERRRARSQGRLNAIRKALDEIDDYTAAEDAIRHILERP